MPSPEPPQHLPKEVHDLYTRAGAAYEKGNDAYAVDLLLQCLALKRDAADPRFLLVLAAERLAGPTRWGHPAHWLRAGRAGVSLLAALLAWVRGDRQHLLAAHDHALTALPSSPWLLLTVAHTLRHHDLLPAAEKMFEAVVRRRPRHAVALRHLAQLCQRHGDYARARRYFEALLAVAPQDAAGERGLKDLDALRMIERDFPAHPGNG